MAHILIDGYNLIGVTHRNLEQARNELIEKLCAYANITGHDITVVFDGWQDGRAVETRRRVGNITVIYSGIGEKADLVIQKVLSTHAQFWIVVSSDREIYDFAEKKHCVSLKAEEFKKRMISALHGTDEKTARGDGEDFDVPPVQKKGNPRRLSRKDKRKEEALKKL